MLDAAATTRRSDQPDELREVPFGCLELVQSDGMTVGRHLLGADTYAK